MVGSFLTLVFTYTAARATLVHRSVLLMTVYLTIAMLSAFGTYMSYEFLHRRRRMLAEQGISH